MNLIARIYDWTLICPVAYTESRVAGQRLRAFLNAESVKVRQGK